MKRYTLGFALLLAACATQPAPVSLADFTPAGRNGERVRVLDMYPGVTATIVAPAAIDATKRVELILYALPNGNTTAQTMGRAPFDSVNWRFDIQHIAAQTRALRARGIDQAIVVYLEADTKSWPAWRSARGYDRANARIVSIVHQLRMAIGNPPQLAVTLTGHSGGGSFAWGFIDGQAALPNWLERIAFLDSNYSFEPRHGEKITRWLRSNPRNTLMVLAYDDREITLDGKKVVSPTGGTWRASQRMMENLRGSFSLTEDRLGEFIRFRDEQIEILLHPNPENRILHTVMVGDMNGYMHGVLVRRPEYERGETVLKPARAYTQYVEGDVVLPPAMPPAIPPRAANALTGSAFIASVASAPREEREAAVLRELMAGNIPSFLRMLRPVEVSAVGADSVKHAAVYDVMPDYLAIGSDADFVRMPMNPYTAQTFLDAHGFVMTTRKMTNDIWTAATAKLDPHPLTIARDSAPTFLQHHRIIEGQLKGHERGVFVAGIKKDVVVSNKLMERAQRVAIYGWHYTNGQPIQPLYTGHVDWYVDYSHGIRPVRRTMVVDGRPNTFEKTLTDPNLLTLLSDEGAIPVPRYDAPRTGYLAVPGGRIYYEVAGAGPAVVLSHGGFGDRRMWDMQFNELARSFRVVRYDHRGFGKSSMPDTTYSPVGDIVLLLDHLGIDKASIVGNSMGGGVAVDFALLRPERVNKLIVVASAANGFAYKQEEIAHMIATFNAAETKGVDTAAAMWLEDPMVAVASKHARSAALLKQMIRDNKNIFRMRHWPSEPMTPRANARLSELRMPTLIVIGDKDIPYVQRVAAATAAGIPHAEVFQMAGTDHLPQMVEPEIFTRKLVEFLKR